MTWLIKGVIAFIVYLIIKAMWLYGIYEFFMMIKRKIKKYEERNNVTNDDAEFSDYSSEEGDVQGDT